MALEVSTLLSCFRARTRSELWSAEAWSTIGRICIYYATKVQRRSLAHVGRMSGAVAPVSPTTFAHALRAPPHR